MEKQKQKQMEKKEKKMQKEPRSHFTIEWRHLTYHQRPSAFSQFFAKRVGTTAAAADSEPRRILDSLDGRFRSGELTAILGPSGAGKTTFLSCLFGSKQEQALGRTRVRWHDSEDATKSGKKHRKRSIRSAVLPQQDHLLNHLTVYEALMFASRLKNASRRHEHHQSTHERHFHRANVRRVAKMLKLLECLDTRCGKLSGGQYKRVSIGQELLSEPDVIVLDEPTSGLDATTCLSTVQTLKSIVKGRPMSIILTIHQPDHDVFALFDHVYVIAQGGLAIYEGPPQGIAPTLELVGLRMPSPAYNPARFIVEHAFVATQETLNPKGANQDTCETPSVDDGDEEDDDDSEESKAKNPEVGLVRQSLWSLAGMEMLSGVTNKPKPLSKRPLLNIGIQTADGKLITHGQLRMAQDQEDEEEQLNVGSNGSGYSERRHLLRRLNAIQRARYQAATTIDDEEMSSSSSSSSTTTSAHSSPSSSPVEPVACLSPCSAKTDDCSSSSSSSGCSSGPERRLDHPGGLQQGAPKLSKSLSLADDLNRELKPTPLTRSLQTMHSERESISSSSDEEEDDAEKEDQQEFVVHFEETQKPGEGKHPRRQFDKRLSAKHAGRRTRRDQPLWHHALLLMHRTWLSIVRDPIFFGIQAALHTTIPFLLAGIFGSRHTEGCPRAGHFDLVDFAYSDASGYMEQTMQSIRLTVGNIGVVFFEMFVLSFAINCITALVFPLDMYVLLKEHRNGWYSMRSYFIGRTLADLPVPLVLHSLAMAILCYMTQQPLSPGRFLLLLLLTNLACLVAQSVGLTIGAILMRSSQSAVLAAAGIVAPFFALSGFIVRIHTLPVLAQAAAQISYLYHLLNGFILLRYGFGRCPCRPEDFEPNEAHQVPSNLHTLASLWVGTYSNEYPEAINNNKSNVDPNIDVVDKMMNAFKMANSYGHPIDTCADVIPYAMLDFNLRDHDIYYCFLVVTTMLVISRLITFSAIYYKVRSFT